MAKVTPSIANKSKWSAKTKEAVGIDCDRKEGIPVGYAIAFFDPFEKDEDKIWSFIIRLGHSQEEFDKEQKERLEVALRYIMLGVQKIFNADKEQIDKWFEEDKDDISNFMAKGKFH